VAHTTGELPTQVPETQLSAWVHRFPSLQVEPLVLAGLEHTPEDGSQLPATWHWSSALQLTGDAPVHVPAWQVSACVHRFPSLHTVPLDLAGLEQIPEDGSQLPATWHWSDALHVTALEPVQLPAWQVSVCVQAFPSLQVVPLAATGLEHAPEEGSHVPAT
jgi:hypothetical protein